MLAKADKLNQAERAALLRESRAALGGAATAQVFSAHSGLGVKEAQSALQGLWETGAHRPSAAGGDPA